MFKYVIDIQFVHSTDMCKWCFFFFQILNFLYFCKLSNKEVVGAGITHSFCLFLITNHDNQAVSNGCTTKIERSPSLQTDQWLYLCIFQDVYGLIKVISERKIPTE